jgi:hypothetical protein
VYVLWSDQPESGLGITSQLGQSNMDMFPDMFPESLDSMSKDVAITFKMAELENCRFFI